MNSGKGDAAQKAQSEGHPETVSNASECEAGDGRQQPTNVQRPSILSVALANIGTDAA